MPADRQYRTPLEKFKMPRTHGPDTAVVVGPAGKEIHDDEFGRIKVHFHWDRYGQKDGSDSCWIRVASPWAGSSTGTVSIPRIGQEVVVDYEHGDPQRPLVTGCVYNAQQMPPWGFAVANTQSGLMSRSTPGGGPGNFNALRFENFMGREVIWLRAERDLNVDVNNDFNLWVVNNQTDIIDGKRDVTVGKGDKLTIVEGGRDVTVTAGGDKLLVEAGGRVETIKGGEGDTLTVDGGKRTETLKNGRKVTVESGEGDTLTVTEGDLTVKVNAGNIDFYTPNTVKVTAGKGVEFETPSFKQNDSDIAIKSDKHIEVIGWKVSATGYRHTTSALATFVYGANIGANAIRYEANALKAESNLVKIDLTKYANRHKTAELKDIKIDLAKGAVAVVLSTLLRLKTPKMDITL